MNDRTLIYDQLINLKNNNLNAASNFKYWFNKHNAHKMCSDIIVKNKLGVCLMKHGPCTSFIYENYTEMYSLASTLGCSIKHVDNSLQINQWLEHYSMKRVDIVFITLKNNNDWLYIKDWDKNASYTFDPIGQIIINVPSIITHSRAQIIYDIDIYKNPFYINSDRKSFNVSFI